MIDEEITISESEDYTPEPEPAPEPAPAAPVEVITVEELLERITGEGGEDGETEEEPSQEAGEDAPVESGEEPFPEEKALEGPIEVIGMDTALKRLEMLQKAVDHPLMTTPFEDYTVTEGLLLLLLLSVFAAACVKLLKGGFAWLR